VERSSWLLEFFALIMPATYFDSLTRLFSDLYLAKFLNTSAKLFFPCA